MARLVLTDASPLIGLAHVDGLAWLPKLFGRVFVCTQVLNEVLPNRRVPGESAIAKALALGHIVRWEGSEPSEPPYPTIDEGEAACIRIAMSAPGECLLLIDERIGRAMAMSLGIRVAGTAALIGLAKKQGLIDAAKPCFERLHRSNFRISAEVIRSILRSVGE